MVLFCLTDGSRWKISEEYPVNAGVLETLYLVLQFSYYTLMPLLIILSVILLPMLMILFSTLFSKYD